MDCVYAYLCVIARKTSLHVSIDLYIMDVLKRDLYIEMSQRQVDKRHKIYKRHMSDNNKFNEWKSLGIFNKDENFSYVFKKTEKIVSAIHLVTNFVKDSEPLKKDIRDESLILLSLSLSLNSNDESGRSHLIHSFFMSAFEISSLLNIASTGELISKMNSSVISNEIDLLVAFIKKVSLINIEQAGYILSDTFFATDTPYQGQGIAPKLDKKEEMKIKTIKDIKDTKTSRQENIINLLKKDSNLTIKDFLKVITDCSEKTIQRELIVLVEKGIVKKEGERRWSRYSLA